MDKHFLLYENMKYLEKEKTDFVSGKFLKCIYAFKVFHENESYWFDYVGDDIYVGRSDNILGKRIHIQPIELNYFVDNSIEKTKEIMQKWLYNNN